MLINRKITAIFFLSAAFTSCTSQGQKNHEEQISPKPINVQSLSELIDTQEDLQVVDVRTPQEHELNYIPGSLNIDYWSDDFSDRINKLDKDKPIAVYCAVGGRSAKAAIKLKELGFKEIYDLDGGMKAWNARPK